jgi:hypothetical protein
MTMESVHHKRLTIKGSRLIVDRSKAAVIVSGYTSSQATRLPLQLLQLMHHKRLMMRR